MKIWELLLVGIGVSMDAFAVSVCKGLSVGKPKKENAFVAGVYFGGFQMLMPLLGYYLGNQFNQLIYQLDHWVAFILLALIGGKMVYDSREESCERMDQSFSPRAMIPLAIATSIDALIVGLTFAVLNVEILPAISIIGITTFAFSAVGMLIGSSVGEKFKSRAELIGGFALIAIGMNVLQEHLRGLA